MSSWQSLITNVNNVENALQRFQDTVAIDLLKAKAKGFPKLDFEHVMLSVIGDLMEEVKQLKETDPALLGAWFRDRP